MCSKSVERLAIQIPTQPTLLVSLNFLNRTEISSLSVHTYLRMNIWHCASIHIVLLFVPAFNLIPLPRSDIPQNIPHACGPTLFHRPLPTHNNNNGNDGNVNGNMSYCSGLHDSVNIRSQPDAPGAQLHPLCINDGPGSIDSCRSQSSHHGGLRSILRNSNTKRVYAPLGGLAHENPNSPVAKRRKVTFYSLDVASPPKNTDLGRFNSISDDHIDNIRTELSHCDSFNNSHPIQSHRMVLTLYFGRFRSSSSALPISLYGYTI